MNRRSSNSCPMRRQTAATLAALPIALAVLLSGPGTTAAQAANAPAGVQVRPASAVQKVSTEGLPLPGVQNGTLELAAPRNGVASAQAIVTAAEEFAGPPCRITDLRSADGGTIPAGKVQIRYADPAPQYVPLHEEPLSGRKVHPVFVTVKVPAEAKAGRYKGTLTLPWADKQIDVPVALTVHAWKIPDPGQWRTCVSLLQSPEAVAGFYNVPLWSDRHFALMEKSFEIMGQTGNKVLGVSAVSKGVFGDDPIIVFRREGGNLVPDFTHLERYLSLYIKHAGPPQFLAVNVWNYTMYNKDFGRGGGGTRDDEKAKVTVAELQGGQLGYGEAPMYGWPGAEKFWQPVMDGICQVVKKAGLRENAILLGTSGDMWPSRSTVEFFKKIAPYAEWRTLTHGQGAPKWGYTQSGRLQPNGMIVGYYDAARLLPNNRIRVLGHPVTCNARDHVGSGPGTFRGLVAILDFVNGYDGVGFKGLDYWTYKAADGSMRSPLGTYSNLGNAIGGTPRALAAPGPHGALATQQLEMLRQGIQECEAMRAMCEYLDVLTPPPVAMCDLTELFLFGGVCKPRGGHQVPLVGGELFGGDLILTIAHHTDGLHIKPQATGFNHFKREAEGKIVKTEPLTFDVQITLDRDEAGQDCHGSYVIEVVRKGSSVTGTYTGKYRGYERKGTLTGSFQERIFPLKTGEPPPPTELAKRCEAMIEEMLNWYQQGVGGDREQQLLARLYALVSEVAQRAAAKP